MIIGNFMLLCEFDPDDVYKWFMELFIDSIRLGNGTQRIWNEPIC